LITLAQVIPAVALSKPREHVAVFAGENVISVDIPNVGVERIEHLGTKWVIGGQFLAETKAIAQELGC
jgi:hypothetical protein